LDASFFTDIIQNSVIIGVGAWTGAILCSPTLLGTTKGLLAQQQQQSRHSGGGGEHTHIRRSNSNSMLFF
jgi:hypothetical protein